MTRGILKLERILGTGGIRCRSLNWVLFDLIPEHQFKTKLLLIEEVGQSWSDRQDGMDWMSLSTSGQPN